MDDLPQSWKTIQSGIRVLTRVEVHWLSGLSWPTSVHTYIPNIVNLLPLLNDTLKVEPIPSTPGGLVGLLG
jgi:hypothetical protein